MPQRKLHLDRSIKQAADGSLSVMRGQFDWPRPDPADDRLVYLNIDDSPVGRVRRSELEIELGRQEAAYVKASPATRRRIAKMDVSQWIGHWAA